MSETTKSQQINELNNQPVEQTNQSQILASESKSPAELIEIEKEPEVTPLDSSSKEPSTEARHVSTSTNPAVLVLVLLALIFSGASLTFSLLNYFDDDTPITINNSGPDGNSAEFSSSANISSVVKTVSPSVVSITTEISSRNWLGQTSTSEAAGTGIIVSSNGYILTNKHVVSGADSISVILNDGTIHKDVSIVATDPLNDIAFLKIPNISDLTPAKLGNSKTISLGEEVIAIGNALGYFTNSITFGVISGTGRTITATDASYSVSETLTDLIQTDAAINAGNSGGPLVNAAGEVIGINSATSGSGENIGFAIPIAAIKGMLAQLLETGSASRTFLGVTSIAITPSVAEEYNLPVVAGAYLISSSDKYNSSAIQKNSPAELVGLKDKDIITMVNGEKIGASGSLSTLIAEYRPGDTVQLALIREGHEMTLNVTLGAYFTE